MTAPGDIGAALAGSRAWYAPHTHHPSIDCGRDCAGVDPTPAQPLPDPLPAWLQDPWAVPNPKGEVAPW